MMPNDARLQAPPRAPVRLAEVKDRLLKGGFEPTGSTAEQFAGFLESELRNLARVAKEAGITVN